MGNKNDLKIILFFTVIIAIGAPLFTYFLLQYIGEYIIVGEAKDWIGFAGSIFGGIITMTALIFTIRQGFYDRKKQREEQIKPYIYFKFMDFIPSEHEIPFENGVNDYEHIRISMINATPNIANNVEFVSHKEYIMDQNGNFYEDKDYTLCTKHGISTVICLLEESIFLPPKTEYNFIVNMGLECDDNGNYKFDESYFMFKDEFIFKYTDVMNEKIYKTKFEVVFNINIDVNNKPHLFIERYSNSIIEN